MTEAESVTSGDLNSIGTDDAWMDYLPAIGALFVVLAGWLTTHYLISCVDGATACKQHVPAFVVETSNRPFAELDAHLGWVAAVSVFLVVAIGTIAVAGWTYMDSEHRANRGKVFGGLILALLVGVPIVHAVVPAFRAFFLDDYLLVPTIYSVFPLAPTAVTVVELVAAAAIVVLIFVVVRSLASQPKRFSGQLTEEEKVAVMKERTAILVKETQTLRVLLVAGALLTVLGVIQVTTLYGWATTMVIEAAPQTGAVQNSASATAPAAVSPSRPYYSKTESVSGPVSMLAGTFYTLLLCAIFLPAFAVTQLRARQLWNHAAPAGATESDRASWFETHKFSMSPPKQLAAGLALLSPTLVAGPLTALLKALTGS